uniref:Uncharacterized protein n=1 Tax=Parascaris univalens TaxID=6257 RepID=A0A914ZWJ0_PARUN
MLDAVGAFVTDGEMFALVYFPTLRNHAVVDLRELLAAGTEGDHVFLDLGGGQRILIEVIDVGAKEDMRQLKNDHLNSRGWVDRQPAKRARLNEDSEGKDGKEGNDEEERPGSSAKGLVVCSCAEPSDSSSELQRLKSEVLQLRADLDSVLAALGIKQRFTPAVLLPDDQRLTPDDIPYSYVSKTEVVLTVRKSRSVTAFARQMARKLFTSGPDKTAKMRDKLDKDKVEWLRRVCSAFYPTADWSQQCAQWAACMRAIDNYTVWFQNRSAIGNNPSILAGLASLRDELGPWNNGVQNALVKGEPVEHVDGEARSFDITPVDEESSSFNMSSVATPPFNMTISVNPCGD